MSADMNVSGSGNLRAGTYNQVTGTTLDLTGTHANNYTLDTAHTSTSSIIIAKKSLSVSSVPIISETYGDAMIYNSGYGNVVSGMGGPASVTFANTEAGDDVSVYAVVVNPQYSISSSTLKAGTYDQITGGTANLEGMDASNYTLVPTTFSNTVTINKRALSVFSISDNIMMPATYGDTVSAGSVTLDNINIIGIRYRFNATARIVGASLSSSRKLKAGTYNQIVETADLTGADAENYTVVTGTSSNSIVVNKKALSVDALMHITSVSATYGDTVVAGSVSLQGVIGVRQCCRRSNYC